MSKTIRNHNWNKLYRWFKALPGKSVEIAFSEFKKQNFLPKAELTWNTFIRKLSAYDLYIDESDYIYQNE